MMDSTEMDGVGSSAVAFDFPVSETESPRVPKRIKKRLLVECNKTPPSVEEIEAKLRHADLRRQQFYANVSNKARTKPKSPSRSSSHEDDLGQRLEARLQAAERKRLSILAKAQTRLARLDELRQAAKTGVEMRFERERQKLGTKVESRVQQAEVNRMLILKSYSQRMATLKERSFQSMLIRMNRESKYKERVHAAMHQKRAAAEKKRLGLLEAEKKRARARVLQVRRVANSVSHQREVERRIMKDQLEDKLQRAKRQRAEYLRQRGRLHSSIRVNWNRMHRIHKMQKQADFLSRKLARCWRRFSKLKKTTFQLTKAYDALKINELNIKSMPFEQLARLMESTTTLQIVSALLDRLENRLKVSKAVFATNQSSSLDNIDHLLKRVATPRRQNSSRSTMRRGDGKKVRVSARPSANVRYPVRIVLSSYMILGHPDAVFNGQGEQESALAKAAEVFVREFELLVKILLEGPSLSSDEESDSLMPKRLTFRSQLGLFDEAWCSYLNSFVVWKVRDARLLEDDLVRAACQLELSMIQNCKLTSEGDRAELTHDMKAIQKQVTEDQVLISEKVQHLSGDAGIKRLKCAIVETRSKYFQAKENGSPIGSPIAHIISQSAPSSPDPHITDMDIRSSLDESNERPSRAVRSLFKEDDKFLSDGSSFSASNSILINGQEKESIKENELIVNEFLHGQHHSFIDSFKTIDEDGDRIEAKVREAMEKAFWDGIMESMNKAEPNYDRVIQLMSEVRDGICEMAPPSWKAEITEAIDLEVLSQVLKSGNLDIDYLGKILGFALVTLQKLSSPASDDEMKARHQNLLKELVQICQENSESNNSHVIAMIRGLRFVLEQIQVLKQEISKAHIRIMEPLLKGPAGLDYLRKAFANRYGAPPSAVTSLALTSSWLSSVWNSKDQEWEEHTSSLSALVRHRSSSQVQMPSTTLKTGGSFLVRSNGSQMSVAAHAKGADGQQPECKGERVDLLVRLGLLKLVTGISGISPENVPETFLLNFSRLRTVQAQVQKIIVISTSILVCRQILFSEKVVANPMEMETIISKCTQNLLELLDNIEDAGVEEIVNTISACGFERDGVDAEKLQSIKILMARLVSKSLQAGDPVFERVSKAVYVAARGVVLGGSGSDGKSLAEVALRQVGGAGLLTERVVEAAEVLVLMATVSGDIHRSWYDNVIDSM